MKKKIFFVATFLFFSFCSIFAAGVMEADLRSVDKLIDELNYNDAIAALSKYMLSHPENFEAAQNRMKRIINIRERYNDKAKDLIDVIVNEPDDDGKKLALISELENLEKNQTEQTRAFIRETKIAAQFTYYRSQFERILREGRAAIDLANYQTALNTYGGGFFFYKEEFDEESPPELKAKVNEQLASINSMLLQFPVLSQTLEDSLVAFELACSSGSLKNVQDSFLIFSSSMTQFIEFRNTIASYGWFMEESFKNSASQTENSFLPFAYRFILGRETSGAYEGMSGTLDTLWQSVMSRASSSIAKTFDKNWNLASTEYSSKNFALVPELTANCKVLLELSQKTYAFSDALARSPRGSFVASGVDFSGIHVDWQSDKNDAEYQQSLCLQMERLTTLNSEVSTHLRTVAAYEPEEITLSHLNLRNIPSLDFYIEHSRYYDSTLSEIQSIESSVSSYSSETKNQFSYDEEILKYVAEIRKTVIEGSYDALYNGVVLRSKLCKLVSETHTGDFIKAAAFADGIEDELGTKYFYPAECLESMNKVLASVSSDIEKIETQMVLARDVSSEILVDMNYSSQVAIIQNSRDELLRLQASATSYIADCRTRVQNSRLAMQAGERFYSEATSALAKADYETARDRLQRSRERYIESLKLQNSDSLRKSTDSKLAVLGEEIIKLENEAVIREVRQFLSSAKTAYYAGDFMTASDQLNFATARWSSTHVEENPEVKKWAGLVSTALSMKTGRTIPVSAPLYPEMSQLLSLANQYYLQGQNQLKRGNTEKAKELLSTAQKKLDDVKTIYPLNQDASLLSLRINQVLDQKASQELFARMYENAATNYKVAGKSQEAYSDLLDLREVNPKYPGINDLIYRVELYLGIRIPPPDPKLIARSKQLTTQAQRVVDSNNRSMFPIALEQLDQAIDLWPENTTAITLKDKVQMATGGKETVVLSFQDEILYQNAVEELRKGNTLLAASYVSKLLENSSNKYSSKILELDKRIKGML